MTAAARHLGPPIPVPGRWEVPFLDLRVEDAEERAAILEAIARVLDHGRILEGPELQELERRLAESCGVQSAVGVGSGTDAVILALRAIGIGPGDEVVTTPLTAVATANAIEIVGATPVFADIAADLNLDPASVEAVLTPRTRAILPVHFTGKVARMPEVLDLARRRGLEVVEDASQAFGASLGGRHAGSFTRVAALSMNPMKVLGGCGEGGVVLANDPELVRPLTLLRYNGVADRVDCVRLSHNARLDTMQAAILLVRLQRLAPKLARRRRIAEFYSESLRDVVETPRETPRAHDVFYTYTIQSDRRDELERFLLSRGIEVKVHHRLLVPDQTHYRDRARGRFPAAKRIVRRILCLPCHEKLSDDAASRVAARVGEFFGRRIAT